MPFLLRNLTLTLGEGEEILPERLSARLSLAKGELAGFSIVRKGVDARQKGRIKFVYTIEFRVADEEGFKRAHLSDPDIEFLEEPGKVEFPRLTTGKRLLVTGMGPAGLFAALRLTEYGLAPTLIERGSPVEERVSDVRTFWEKGLLDPESNVQFGEGGAGTFSDGKLTTRVRDRNIDYLLHELVRFGAPPEILYLAKPHIGTDRLRQVVIGLRECLAARGVDIRFRTRLTDLLFRGGRLTGVTLNDRAEEPCDVLVLAPGNSARDTYRMLMRRSVLLEQKPFAVGVRVEHPQELINRIQYGIPGHPQLPPADYALAWNNAGTGRSAYSFCMCPGGEVVAGSSEEGGVVTNGMSSYRRNSPYANSALVVSVGKDDFGGDFPLAGMEFQRALEQRAFVAGGGDYLAPAQNLLAFLGDRRGGALRATYLPGVREADLSQLLPPAVTETLREGIRHFDRKMRGFITGEACLIGVESRTSAPVRIVRDGDFQSVSLKGLYPAGEGAGYAGGIMSAALDGIRIADRIAQQLTE
ncbi:MAG TPA: hypothetical protein VL949_10910 [Geobacteraceae bacterium]|nr:hypothetical protein [Geobacteraceae bacterium]